ncbi:MAG: hypothetical protein AAGF01_11450 [Cyanobacteria bacterium P01_G01_bin.38]
MKNVKVNTALDEGWTVHVYDRNRRLRCTLDTSHGWVFGTGVGLGILVALLGVNLNLSTNAPTSEPPISSPSPAALPSAPTVISQPAQTNDFLFWVD